MNRRAFLASLPVVVLAGCASNSHVVSDPGMVRVTSSAFKDGGTLPAPYNCAGGGISPPLTIQKIKSAKTWAVLATSTPVKANANQSSTTTTSKKLTHWLIWNIPIGQALPKGIPHGNPVASINGATQGKNDFGAFGYSLGCPFTERRSLEFSVYLLSETLHIDHTISANEFTKTVYNSNHLDDIGGIQVTVGEN